MTISPLANEDYQKILAGNYRLWSFPNQPRYDLLLEHPPEIRFPCFRVQLSDDRWVIVLMMKQRAKILFELHVSLFLICGVLNISKHGSQ